MDENLALVLVPALAYALYTNLDEISPSLKITIDGNIQLSFVILFICTLYTRKWPQRAKHFAIYHVSSLATAGSFGELASIVGPMTNIFQSFKLLLSNDFNNWSTIEKSIAFLCEMASTIGIFIWCHGERSLQVVRTAVPLLIAYFLLTFTVIMTGINTDEPYWRALNLRRWFAFGTKQS